MFTPKFCAGRVALWLVVGCLLLSVSVPGGRAQISQEAPLNVQAIVSETQQMSDKEGALTMAWWIPEQFWRASLASSHDVPPATSDAIVKALGEYTVVAVIDAKLGALGKLDYTPDTALASQVFVKDASGNAYQPLPDDQIEGDTKAFLGMMKPFLENMLGALGQNMHFFVFPRRNKKGDLIADATKEGLFYVEVGKEEFRWRLPLGSLLARKICPTCKESLSGAYKYCPYDGTKLPEPASAPNPGMTH